MSLHSFQSLYNFPKDILIKIICCLERPKYYLMRYSIQYTHHFDKIVGPFYTEEERITYLKNLDDNFNEENFKNTKVSILEVEGIKYKYISGEMNI